MYELVISVAFDCPKMEGDKMPGYKVSLFGKFNIEHNQKNINDFPSRKVQELFCYLLLFRNHPQSREILSETLWCDQPPAKSKKNLRQTLWRLQSTLKTPPDSYSGELLIEDDWIQLNPAGNFWLDVAEFEKIFDDVKEKHGWDLDQSDFDSIQSAVGLYKGDLLEGWYPDWCTFERERLQTKYLMLLDKLVQYCEIHQNYDAGLVYAAEILQRDHAYERAHRQVMRLYIMSGDRTQAIRQYERCVTALRDELDVNPSERTIQLYEQIRLDSFKPPAFSFEGNNPAPNPGPMLDDVLNRLEQFSKILVNMDLQVKKEILLLENKLALQK